MITNSNTSQPKDKVIFSSISSDKGFVTYTQELRQIWKTKLKDKISEVLIPG